MASPKNNVSCRSEIFTCSFSLSLAMVCAVPIAIGCGSSPSQSTGAAGSMAGTGGGTGAAGSAGGTGTAGSAGGTGGTGGTGGSAVNRVQTCVPPADRNAPAPKLSETGCMSPTDPKVMASSVVPYEVNSPLWSDAADKQRGLALPTGAKIHVKNCAANPSECPGMRGAADDGRWLLPDGTVLVKSFLFDGKLLETRLLVHFDGTSWIGYTYKWDEAQTDATLVGTERDEVMFATGSRTVRWQYPARRDCMRCHLEEASFALGTETAQMNRVVGGMNQIDRLAAMDAFDAPVPKPYKAALVAPYPSQAGSPPANATIEQRATSYLHANCGFCHRPADDVDCTSEPCLDLRFGLSLASRSTCNVAPGKGDYGIAGAMTLAPGSPDKSMIVYRMKAKADDNDGRYGRMPLIASYVVDQPAVDLVSQWISQITACP